MSGFGALGFMNKTLKNNRGLIKKINVFERIKPYNSVLKGKKISISRTTTIERLAEIKAESIAESKKHSLIQAFKIIGVLIILIIILITLIGGVFVGKS